MNSVVTINHSKIRIPFDLETLEECDLSSVVKSLGIKALSRLQGGKSPQDALMEACQEGKIMGALTALLRGADINQKDAEGNAPLHVAIKHGHQKLTKTLLTKGASLKIKDKNGQTPFFLACQLGHFKIVKFMIDHGADVNERDDFDNTPLLLAKKDSPAICKLLIEKGADVRARNIVGETFLIQVFHSGHIEEFSELECDEYEKAFFELKILSHWLGLSGNVMLFDEVVNLEGEHHKVFDRNFAQLIEEFQSKNDIQLSLKSQNLNTIKQAFFEASRSRSNKQILQKIQNKELCFLEGGWEGHSVCLSFFGEYLALCNRTHENSIEVYKIDPQLMTEEILEKIHSNEKRHRTEGKDFLYKQLPALLSPTGKKENVGCILTTLQKVGNCTLASRKAAFRFAYTYMLLQSSFKPKTFEKARRETKIFMDWGAIHMHDKLMPQLSGVVSFNAKIKRQISENLERKKERLSQTSIQNG